MKNNLILSFISLTVILLMACEKDANIKLPDSKSKPVISCYISPTDTIISLLLTRSKPVFGNNNFEVTDPVTDAIVVMYGNNTSVNLMYNPIKRAYETTIANMPVLSGGRYRIKVKMPDGQEAEAETIVPESHIPVEEVNFENIENDESNKRIRVSITDEPVKTNYYRMGFNYLYTFNSDTMYAASMVSVLKTDQNLGGKKIEFVADFNEYLESIYAYDIYLLNINLDYFNFYNSLSKVRDITPFTEPTIVYTNVKGGLGVFAAYTRTKVRKFK
jgi:hypothetical protein